MIEDGASREGGPEPGSEESLPAPGTDPSAPGTDTGEDGSAEPVCALPGCGNPLPSRLPGENGGRRGGRPPVYCCKAHADAASRQRRARDVASVTDPLLQVRSLTEVLVPGARQLADTVRELLDRLEQAEAGALARVRAAEEDAERARKDVDRAEQQVRTAQRQREQALDRAREDRESRTLAERRAAEQAEDAERVRRTAWNQVAEHERARGRAEAARVAAEDVRDRTVGRLREAEERVTALLAEHAALTERLAETERSLARSVTEAQSLRHRAAELRAELDAERARGEQTNQQIVRLSQELFEQQETVRRAQEDLAALRNEREEASARLSEVQGRLERLLAAGLREFAGPGAGAAGHQIVTCPACGERAEGRRGRRLRRELDAVWLEPGPARTSPEGAGGIRAAPQTGGTARGTGTGGLRVRRFCTACAPRAGVVVVGCLSCGELVRAVDVPGTDLRRHLEAVGWRTGDGPDLSGSLCPACCVPEG